MAKAILIFSILLGIVVYTSFNNNSATMVAINHPTAPNCSSNDIFDLDLQNNFPNISETEMEYAYDYEKLITDLNLNNRTTFPFFGFPFIASVFLQRHIFRSISDFVFAYRFNDLKAENVKCGDIIFVKTDYIKEFLLDYHPKIKYPYILLTHESDYGVGYPWQLKILNDTKIIKWFAQNPLASHPKLIPLPLGVVPPKGNIFSTLYDLARNVTPYHNKTKLLYLNFSPTTNRNRIKTLYYFQRTFGNNSLVKINQKRTSWKEYLENMKDSQFVLSPPGNGMDCIRTWESIILGSIPIVKRSYLQPLYDNLPVMVVKDWSEVTEETMKKFQKENLKNFSKDGLPWRPSIWLRYWIKEIVGTKLNYIKNFC